MEIVKNCKIDLNFSKFPNNCLLPKEINFNPEEVFSITSEISSFLTRGIIQKVSPCPGQFVSKIFYRQKPNGSIRLILDLSQLNEFIEYEHFKMESFQTALDLIEENCFFGSVDLKDSYYSVSIHCEYRKFLRFTWLGVLYEFTCMPNGLACAPRLFTKGSFTYYVT